MTIFNTRRVLALLAMTISIAAVPSTASARGSVHVDIPGFSIGFHDHDRHYRKRHKRYKRHYRKHHRNHHRGYRYRSYDYYPRRSYRYNDYYDDYRGRSNRRGYRDDYEYCPTPGYSSRYYRNRGCYSHGDHYHCDG